ncbi:MAG TPA: hypothetical protein VM656_15730, partial [Pyrinomonadaceae bacterium]|nr:hypothetical protein [Pyrinomonadaceae bacterium]
GYQQDKTGAFINDHQSNTPGYTTGVYLEGIAAALQIEQAVKIEQVRKRGLPPLSQQRGQAALPDLFFSRRSTYYDSFARGLAFLDQLIIQERDRAILPNLDFALGGLRQGLHYSEIRTDFVQHSLSAILEFSQGAI